MNPCTGYFSIIQYVPDPSRLEAANIGVLLFAPQMCFLKAVTVGDNRRIARFFGREGHDWVRINSFKKGIEERVTAENARIHTLAELETFIAQRANQFRITDPRALKVHNAEKDLRDLFDELVGGTPRGRRLRQNFLVVLRQRFSQPGLERKVARDILVEVPSFDQKVTFPYGYKNGVFNLIKPVRFESEETSHAISTACRYAVEGHSLYENPHPKFGKLKLIVVGQFPQRKANNRPLVQKILDEHQVKLYSSTEIDLLIQNIRETGKQLDLPA